MTELKISPQNSFISYATKYDTYVGTKNWNELTLEQRKTIVEFEFNNKEMTVRDFEDYVIATGLKKKQAAGIRSLYVASLMLNERIGLIKADVKGEKDRHYILAVFANTRFFREVNNLLQDKAEETTDYDGKELERLGQSNNAPSIFDDALDMSNTDARHFINSQLAVLYTLNEQEGKLEVKEKEQQLERRKSAVKKWSFFDLFVCDEVKWIKQAIRDFFERHDTFVNEAALKESLQIASNSNKAKYSVRVEQIKPQNIALIIIRNVAHEKIINGHYHIYRGILSMLGADYLKLFFAAVDESVKLGFVSEADAKRDKTAVMAAIKEVG